MVKERGAGSCFAAASLRERQPAKGRTKKSAKTILIGAPFVDLYYSKKEGNEGAGHPEKKRAGARPTPDNKEAPA